MNPSTALDYHFVAITYSAPKGTEVSTCIGGEEVRISFGDKGTFTTDDEALIAILDANATAKGHPISFKQKETK